MFAKTATAGRSAPSSRLKVGIEAISDYAESLAPFDQRQRALWAADCAEHVCRNFERLQPADRRPRQGIEAARAWARGEITMMAARAAAVKTHAAAREADHPAAVAAARSAGHASATAHSIRHAPGAAAYAIVSAVASVSEDQHELAIRQERDWQISRLPSEK